MDLICLYYFFIGLPSNNCPKDDDTKISKTTNYDNLKICYWNANGGVIKKKNTITKFLHQSNVDVLLINETHLTKRKVLEIKGYDYYNSKHPAGTSRGGAGVLIKSRIPHKLFKKHSTHQIQACSVIVDLGGTLILTAFYSPPSRPYPTKEDYANFFKDHGDRFIVAGDFNAKHAFWGSGLDRQTIEEEYSMM